MGILDLFKKEVKEVKVEDKKIGNLTVLENPTLGPSTVQSKGLEAYKEWVYANVRARAKGVADIELELYQDSKDDPIEITKHPILEVLYHANGFQSLRDLIDTTITHMDLTGESFWFLDRGGATNFKQKPRAFWPLRPDLMTVVPGDLSKGQFIDRYEYQVPGSEKLVFAPWEILHFMYVDPKNPYRGLSIVEAAAQTIDTDNFASEFNRRFFMNSARPDAILYTEQRLQPETLERIRKTWNQKFRGPTQSSKLAILEAGLQYQQLQMNQKDMDFLNQQKWTRDKIMSIFGNTPVVLGVVEDVNRANAQTSEAYWKEHTIQPLMRKFVDTLNEFLVPIYGDNIFLSFADPVPRDEMALVKELKDLTNLVYTVNEARALKGLPDIEGGDVLQPKVNTGFGGESEEVPNEPMKSTVPSKMAIRRSLGHEVKRMRNRNLQIKEAARELDERLQKISEQLVTKKKIVKKKIIKHKKVDLSTYEAKEIFHKQILKVSYKYEDLIKNVLINEIYPLILRETVENIQSRSKSVKKSDRKEHIKEFLFDRERAEEYAKQAFEPILARIAKEQADQTVAYYSLDANVEDKGADINEFAVVASAKVAKSFTKTANSRLKRAIAAEMDEEATSAELVSAAEAEMKKLEKTQTEQVSVSEVSRATNFGILLAMVLSHIMYKEWFTALDERVCGWCASMEGRTIPVGESYFDRGDSLTAENENRTPVTLDFEYGSIEAPPLHPLCRCTLSPSFSMKTNNIMITKKPIIKEIDESAIEDRIIKAAEEAAKKMAKETSERQTAEDRIKLQTTVDKIEGILNEPRTAEEDREGDK